MKRLLLLANVLLVARIPMAAQDFYELRLRAGETELSASRPEDAAATLRIAAFGLLDRPALLCEALAHKALAEEATGQPSASESTLRRLAEVSRSQPACREAHLDSKRRAEFEQLVGRRLPAGAVRPIFAPAPARAEGQTTAAIPPAATARVEMPARATPPPQLVTPIPAPPAQRPPPPTSAPTSTPAPAESVGNVSGAEDLDRQPQLKTTTRPAYPPGPLQRRVGGVVLLRVLVSERGQPLRVEVARGIEPDLDRAAAAAVRQWTFEPGRMADRPVTSWMNVAVPFDPSR
jgi:protein TonB